MKTVLRGGLQLALACWLISLGHASEFPALTIPQTVGVNIHFVQGHADDLDRIAAAGIKWIRMDFVWDQTERIRGEYDWSAYDGLASELARRRMRAIYILDYSNPLYEQTLETIDAHTGRTRRELAAPQHPESVAAYARWAAAAARHFQGRHLIWELWNEPNGGSFWRPKPDAPQYTTMALAAARAIRDADPDATIIGPASSGFPWPYLDVFLRSGILKYLDGVSVHPYREYRKSPETAASDYAQLREMIRRHGASDAEKSRPIVSGEWGYSTYTRGLSLDRQAAFLVRQQLFNVAQGIPISIWYDWKNDGPDPAEVEHNFGIVRSDLHPKPAYRYLKVMTAQLAGFTIERLVPNAAKEDCAYQWVNAAGERKITLWSLDGDRRVRLKITGPHPERLTLVTAAGQKKSLPLGREIAEAPETEAPAYIALGGAEAEFEN